MRAMVAFLVREAGADIWAEGHMEYVTIGSQHSGRRKHILFPLHTAAHCGIQQVLDFFFTECNMPVNTRSSVSQLTALHLLAMSPREEAHLLRIVTWLVQEKGADALCVNAAGATAAQTALFAGKKRICQYLQAQEQRQAARKNEERAAAAAVASRMQATEKAMAELFLELEEEEKAAAATASKTK